MGERCFIKAHNEPEPIGGGSKARYAIGMAFEVDYDRIPLLWIALFDDDNLKIVDVPENYLEENPPKVAIPTLHASKSMAIEAFERRIPVLRNHIEPAIWPFVELFQRAVEECKYSYLELDLHALWWTLGKSAGELKEVIRSRMQAFESDVSWRDLYGDKLIGDTSDLYGLPFFGSPFEGEIELPWCHATPDGGVEPSNKVDPVSVDYIDAATAERFLEDPESVDIRWATGISDEAAAILADYGGDLLLDGLESLSPTAASALANHHGYMLGLASLASLTEETGAALGTYKGKMIAFRGLEELSPEVAKGLSAFAGDILEMDSLDSISDETAEALGSSRSDCLSLDGLMYLSAGAARGLANFRGSYLYLNRIQSLCPEAMEALGKYSGCLGLQSLSDE
jgi:hypothetical protein